MKPGFQIVVSVLLASIFFSEAEARPGFWEYGKARTRTKRTSRSVLAQPTRRSRTQPAAPSRATRVQHPPTWSLAWFSDRSLVRAQVVAVAEAISHSMIGERYPLPRGGGFRCTGTQSAGRAPGDEWVLRCAGPELGGTRENDFYQAAPNASPILERVHWVFRSPSKERRPWLSFHRELTDSLLRVMGRPAWVSPDSMASRWSWSNMSTTVRFDSGPAEFGSLEVTCLSDRLAGEERSGSH
jgi:hypothetical protein